MTASNTIQLRISSSKLFRIRLKLKITNVSQTINRSTLSIQKQLNSSNDLPFSLQASPIRAARLSQPLADAHDLRNSLSRFPGPTRENTKPVLSCRIDYSIKEKPERD